jgi:pilus assembly protein CpaC
LIGGLFRASKFEKNETELVIVVTPHLVKPLGEGPPPLPTDHFIEPNAWEFYILGALEGRLPLAYETVGLIGDTGYRMSPEIEEISNDE